MLLIGFSHVLGKYTFRAKMQILLRKQTFRAQSGDHEFTFRAKTADFAKIFALAREKLQSLLGKQIFRAQGRDHEYILFARKVEIA